MTGLATTFAPPIRALRRPPPSSARPAFVGLLVFLALVYTNPSNLFPVIGDYGYAKAAAGVALLALFGAWLLGDRRLTVGGGIGWALLGFFGIVGASVLWSLWPGLTVDTFTDGIKYLAIFFLVANVLDRPGRARTLVHALAIATLAPALGAISSWSRGEHLVEGDRAGWIGIFANPNDLAYYLTVGVAMTLAAREQSRRAGLRLFYLGALGVLGAALFLTQSRGGLIAAGTVVGLWLLRGMKRPAAAAGLLAVVVLAVHFAPEKTWQRAETIGAYQEDASAQGRLDAWRTGFRVVEDRPLGGVGAGAFMLAWPEYAPGDAGPARTAHNTFIQLVAETGIPSLLLFFGAIVAALLGLERVAKRTDLAVSARATQIGLAGFLVASTTGGHAYSWPVYVLLGMAAGMARTQREDEAASASVSSSMSTAAA